MRKLNVSNIFDRVMWLTVKSSEHVATLQKSVGHLSTLYKMSQVLKNNEINTAFLHARHNMMNCLLFEVMLIMY